MPYNNFVVVWSYTTIRWSWKIRKHLRSTWNLTAKLMRTLSRQKPLNLFRMQTISCLLVLIPFLSGISYRKAHPMRMLLVFKRWLNFDFLLASHLRLHMFITNYGRIGFHFPNAWQKCNKLYIQRDTQRERHWLCEYSSFGNISFKKLCSESHFCIISSTEFKTNGRFL